MIGKSVEEHQGEAAGLVVTLDAIGQALEMGRRRAMLADGNLDGDDAFFRQAIELRALAPVD